MEAKECILPVTAALHVLPKASPGKLVRETVLLRLGFREGARRPDRHSGPPASACQAGLQKHWGIEILSSGRRFGSPELLPISAHQARTLGVPRLVLKADFVALVALFWTISRPVTPAAYQP